jgi:hypothetical protein
VGCWRRNYAADFGNQHAIRDRIAILRTGLVSGHGKNSQSQASSLKLSHFFVKYCKYLHFDHSSNYFKFELPNMTSSNEVPRGSAEVDAEKAGRTITNESKDEYPGPQKVFLIMIGAYLSMFLVALDRTIIGTAIPKITDDFHSINDVGWYASAYLITLCAFQLVFGRIYTFYSAKWVLLCAIGIFELGVSGPTSEVELRLDLLTCS